MAITVEELVTKWSLNFDGKALQSIQDRLGKLKETLAVVGAGFAAASSAVLATAKFTSDAGVQFERISGMTGVTTDSVQELAYSFDALAGIDLGQFSDLLTSFSRRMTEAIQTQQGEAWEGLTKLRFNIDRLKNAKNQLRDPIDALYQISDAIANVPRSEGLLLADKFFEGETEAVLNVLRRGSKGIQQYRQEARELGLVLDSDGIKKSIQFSMAMHRLGAVMTGLRNSIGVELLPVLSDMIDSTIKWVKENRELVSSGLIAFSKDLINVIMLIGKGFVYAISTLSTFIEAMGGVDKALRVMNITLAGFAVWAVGYLLAIAAIPLAIGAAILLAAFLVEDLWTFLEGGDSVFGDILGWLKPIVEWFHKLPVVAQMLLGMLLPLPLQIFLFWDAIQAGVGAFQDLWKKAKETFHRISTAIDDAVNNVTRIKDEFFQTFEEVKKMVLEFLDFMTAKFTVKNMLSMLSSGVESLLPDGTLSALGYFLPGLSMLDQSSPLSFASGITPATSPVFQPRRDVQNNQTYQYTFAPQLPSLPANLSRSEATRALERSAADASNDFMQYLRNQSADNQDEVDN